MKRQAAAPATRWLESVPCQVYGLDWLPKHIVHLLAPLLAGLVVVSSGMAYAGQAKIQDALEADGDKEAQTQLEHPLANVQPAIPLVPTLDEAKSVAESENRILLLLPSSWKTDSKSGVCGPVYETFRAEILVDDRVRELIDRRFVVYAFDMVEYSEFGDMTAMEMTLRLVPELKFEAVMPTPPIMFVSRRGNLLNTTSFFASADEFLTAMAAALEKDELNELTEQEKTLPVLEQCRVLYSLRQLDTVLEKLGDDQSSLAWYLRGTIAAERQDWTGFTEAIQRVTDETLHPDIDIQILRYQFANNAFDEIIRGIEAMPAEHKHRQEADYYLGLAWYHQSNVERALQIWADSIVANPDSLWSLKIDRTRGVAKFGPEMPFLPTSRPESLLGRKYLVTNGVPELKPRSRSGEVK